MNILFLKHDLEQDEGIKPILYRDHLGMETFGIGHNAYKPLTRRAIDTIFEDDLDDVIRELSANLPWWREMTEPRQRALANMCFQLGYPRLAEFKEMLAALQAEDWKKAHNEALDSRWAKQTPGRAKRIAKIFLEG